MISDIVGISGMFVDTFSSVYVSKDPIEPHPYQEFDCHMEDLHVVCEEEKRV